MNSRHIDLEYNNQNNKDIMRFETTETVFLKEKIKLIKELKELNYSLNIIDSYKKILEIDQGQKDLNIFYLQSFINNQLELINNIHENFSIDLNKVSIKLIKSNCDNIIKSLNKVIEDKEIIKIKY